MDLLRARNSSSLLPVLSAVFLVGHHVANVNLGGSIVDVRGQAILVPANVEDRELANRIRVRIRLAHLREAGPPQSLPCPIPVIERRLCVLVQSLAAAIAVPSILTQHRSPPSASSVPRPPPAAPPPPRRPPTWRSDTCPSPTRPMPTPWPP